MSRAWFEASEIRKCADWASDIAKNLAAAEKTTKGLPDSMLFCELATIELFLKDVLAKSIKLRALAEAAADPARDVVQRSAGALKAKEARLKDKAKQRRAE